MSNKTEIARLDLANSLVLIASVDTSPNVVAARVDFVIQAPAGPDATKPPRLLTIEPDQAELLVRMVEAQRRARG